MSSENEVYKNPPVVETIFEIRFPGEPTIECNRDKLYEKMRNMYPRVFCPKLSPGTAMALQPYRFERQNGSSGIMLSIDKIACYCKKYESFKLFREEAMNIFSVSGQLFRIQKLKRTGLRYINIIPFTREQGVIPLRNYLNIQIGLPKSIPTDFKNLGLIFVSRTEGGSITTRIEPAISSDKTQEAILLDFDYVKEKNLNFSAIDKYLDESHQHTKHLFNELITDDYKKVMRGEIV